MSEILGQLEPMKYRIAIWGLTGVLVAGFWTLYFFLTAHFFLFATVPLHARPIAFTLARLTCPIAFVSFYFHVPIGIYWVLLANAVTYALVGLLVETLSAF